ncbi:riboflavin transporter FmnP [Bacillus sp. FJAT-27225]|uniref:ECF transporter S component n=1 Tax=Bacillus sp. FJAT-27225 TaxID=1743144 RepID=UPI00080C35C4|nr:ECF transporter S component [Bacillus sp. FJAT-27225]OCA90967.1 riboflavin transporter FmnP [Bacillus sp. FJAT-27225]
MKKMNVKTMVVIGMLSSLSYVLMLLNFPLPVFPAYLMIDFSDIPALVAALAFGPLAGVLVELIKNILDWFMTGSQTGVPVGHIANFAAGILFILPTYYVYNKIKTRRGLSLALIAGTVTMAVLMSVLNYFLFLPAYTWFLNAPAMADSEALKSVVLFILPFNILKGIIVSVLFMPLYVKMSYWINRQRTSVQLNG